MPSPSFRLPSILPSEPGYQDITTTLQQLEAADARAKVTDPDQTPIFICALEGCFRLYPTPERLIMHRKRDHTNDSESEDDIITWNNTRASAVES